MPAEKRVLVVMPVFNRSSLVIDALDSVLAQTRPADEIIIIDDGSTDSTPAAIADWISAHPHAQARLISTPNQGAAAARNLGFASAVKAPDHVAFLDSDDLWPADFLARAVAAFDARPDAVVAVADREFHHLDTGVTKPSPLIRLAVDPLLFLLKHGAGMASAALIKASAFTSAGGFPVHVPTGHDVRLFINLADAGPWAYLPGSPVIFRVGFANTLPGQEPHLHRRYADRHIRWAEVFTAAMQARPASVRRNVKRETRYHLMLMDRYMRVLLIELGSLQFSRLPRCMSGLWQTWKDLRLSRQLAMRNRS